MSISLSRLLDLVGKLDDTPGTDTPRERFRGFLKSDVKDLGTLRDYIEGCLRGQGDQYSCAFQDLVNHLGTIMGFEVEFGRYRGVSGEIGFDGLWKSPTGFNVVVEAKKSDVYAVKTSTLLNYVDELISERRIPDWDRALGLYVIGRAEPGVSQLEKAIIAEKNADKLRTMNVGSLVSLAELMVEYDVDHEDVLAVIKPSGPAIDPVVDLIARLVTEEPTKEQLRPEVKVAEEEIEEAHYWMTPVRGDKDMTAEEVIRTLVGEIGIYAFGERTPGRTTIKPGDWMCFYSCGAGVVAHCQVASSPERKPHPKVRLSEKYPWTFKVRDAKLYLDRPVAIDASLRERLDAFSHADARKPWGWFVVTTRVLSKRDFLLLTGQSES